MAVRAAESKKAIDVKVLDLTGITSFADTFVICTGANQRQVQAIADEVGQRLKKDAANCRLVSKDTLRASGCWRIMATCWSTFSRLNAREYYDLERLWRNAKTVEIPPESVPGFVKIFLYFIGKPRDAHANAIAEDFLGRAARYAPCEMREIRPGSSGSVGETSHRAQDLLRSRGQAARFGGLREAHCRCRNGRARSGLPDRRPRWPAGGMGRRARTCCCRFRP